MKTLNVPSNYFYQGPRFKYLGPNSAEQFKEEQLNSFLDSLNGEEGLIDFSGTKVFMASWIAEAFYGKKEDGYNLSFKGMPYEWLEFTNKMYNEKKIGV